jgi:flagellar protein FlaF
MGFGSVIATGISIIVLLAAGYLLVGGITQSADVTGASIKATADIECQRMNTVLAIDEIGSNREEEWFSFHLENVGSEKIADITQMDVIVKTTGLNQSVYYVPYGAPGQHPAVYWDNDRISSIMAGIGDAVNPGMLDPGEYVNIRVHEAGGFPSNTAWVQVTAPNGASASGYVIIT